MEGFKKTTFAKVGSWLLALAIVVTSITLPQSAVNAEEVTGTWDDTGLVANGDFETKDWSKWTITTVSENSSRYSVTNDEWAENNTSYFFKTKEGNEGEVSLTQKVELSAGIYKVALEVEGQSMNSGLSVSVTSEDGSKTYATKKMPDTTGWDQWTAVETGSFEIGEAQTVVLGFSGTTPAGYWGSIDNVKILSYTEPDTPALDKSELQALVDSVPENYETMGFKDTAALKAALDTANTVLTSDEATESEIEDAYTALETAIAGLIFADDDIFVKKLSSVSDNDIRGMDISSYISIMDSFGALNAKKGTNYGFKDYAGNTLSKQGFFDFLADEGVNYVRIRVWNNPYTAKNEGYGGGNNDLQKAIEMGQYATKAGMKVLIDFHFSDFWADPGKQQAPKAWADLTADDKAVKVSEYTKAALTELLSNNVDVAMVQIGNETNGAFCGENSWDNMNKIFDAGCDAVHEVAAENDKEILAAIHFTNPETSGRQAGYADELAKYNNGEGVSYDVFATSYYPYWHGSLSNLKSVLSGIANNYGKYVMVAETSYANTLEDTDGHENTVRVGTNDTGDDLNWLFTNQGQANEFRDVLETVTSIDTTLENGDEAGLGVFYWEGAWIAVQNVYDEKGEVNETLLAENKAMWEQYGSGWASSYASEYDPEDAGKWYGGSAVDNQAFFGADGKALSSLKVFNPDYLKYGAETAVKVDGYTIPRVTVQVGSDVETTLTKTDVEVINNDGTTATKSVTWNASDVQKLKEAIVDNAGIGTHAVNGTLTEDTAYAVQCIVTVIPKNLLKDPSFDSFIGNSTADWTVSGNGYDNKHDDPHTGKKCLHFYYESAFSFDAKQEVVVTEPGIYAAYVYAQGDTNSSVTLSVSANDVAYTSEETLLQGWAVWQQPKVSDIIVTKSMIEEGNNTLVLNIHVEGAGGSWGSVDDAYLYIDTVFPTEITIEPEKVSIEEKKTTKLTANYKPNAATSESIVWTSSDETVATVDKNGTVTGVKAGKAVVTATNKYDESVFGNCVVTVTKKVVTPDPKPEKPATDPVKPAPQPEEPKPAAEGTKLTEAAGSFKVTSDAQGAPEVEFAATASKKVKKVTIPETVTVDGVTYKVTSISDKAFYKNKKLTTVTIGSNVTEIGSSAFSGCTSLTKVTIPKNVETIGSKAFYGCKKLKTITIKSTSIKKVGSKAFKGIKSNATIKVPSKKLKTYKKLFKGKGQASTVKIKK